MAAATDENTSNNTRHNPNNYNYLDELNEFREYYKTVSAGLNASISSAYPSNENENLSVCTVDDTFASVTTLDETLKPDHNNSTYENARKNRNKRKRARSLDKSIIFVDEYIPDSNNKIKKTTDESSSTNSRDYKKLIKSVIISTKTTKRKRRLSDCTDHDDSFIDIKKFRHDRNSSPKRTEVVKWQNLFTRSDRKRNFEYNMNLYNPNRNDDIVPIRSGRKRMIILDGSNIAFHHALGKEFSVKGLDIALKYFEELGHEVKAIVPQFRLQHYKSTNPNLLDYLHRCGKIVLTPCKNLPGMSSTSYDDRYILQVAIEFDGAIVSNDNYRDLLHENPGFRRVIENRVIGYAWCNDVFILPKDPYGQNGPTLLDILNYRN